MPAASNIATSHSATVSGATLVFYPANAEMDSGHDARDEALA